jgi:prevent-host-death family protein
MAERRIRIRELKSKLSECIRDVRIGGTIVMTEHGRPVARMIDGLACVRQILAEASGSVHVVLGIKDGTERAASIREANGVLYLTDRSGYQHTRDLASPEANRFRLILSRKPGTQPSPCGDILVAATVTSLPPDRSDAYTPALSPHSSSTRKQARSSVPPATVEFRRRRDRTTPLRRSRHFFRNWTGVAYELGGSAFDLFELAEAITTITGTTVRYRDLPVDEYVDALTQSGLDQNTAEFVAALDASISRGDLETNSQDLEHLLGRPATSLAAVIGETQHL